ncbi:carboxymuconolactone decarboxylase family protein [Nocardioides sp. cx-169]|uniref:carboxymuconolactone decarboxylase family protein n=1 Tax=Nocardioides sp. cx-169 TaxID=2899080 RepID=UPI001E395C28|nr:carboxymuconolactone decarboxylase family protein [Nocardioides sp. cx-169]MCD4534330.1 carboxymuconolactone decarboxylase family protein [Nocardioides sp. cx-169]
MPRSEPHDPASLNDAQRALYHELRSGPRADPARPGGPVDADGRLTGPFDAMLHSPAVGAPLQRLGAALRYESGLDDQVREMVVLLVAGHHDCAYERVAHERIARRLGMAEETIASLAAARVPEAFADGVDHTAAPALELAERMLTGRLRDDPRLEDLRRALGPAGAFEVSTLVGYYQTLAHQLALFGVEPPDGPEA